MQTNSKLCCFQTLQRWQQQTQSLQGMLSLWGSRWRIGQNITHGDTDLYMWRNLRWAVPQTQKVSHLRIRSLFDAWRLMLWTTVCLCACVCARLFEALVWWIDDSSGISRVGWGSFWQLCSSSAHRRAQKHLHEDISTHAPKQTVLGHLVCLWVWVSLWGRVQLVWQQDTDS